MIEIDKETAVFILSYIQRKADKQAGLRIQNIGLKKHIQELERELDNKEVEIIQLAEKLSQLNHDLKKMEKISSDWEQKYFEKQNECDDLKKKRSELLRRIGEGNVK